VADVIRSGGVDESRRLLAVDRLVEVAVKKGVLHVELVDGPGTRSGDAENSPDGCRFDHRAECLVVVYAVLLGEAADDPARLVPSKSTVGMVLMLEDPLPGDDVGTRRSGNETPGAVVNQGLKLISHGSSPIRIGEPATVVRRERGRDDGGQPLVLYARNNTRLCTSHRSRGFRGSRHRGRHRRRCRCARSASVDQQRRCWGRWGGLVGSTGSDLPGSAGPDGGTGPRPPGPACSEEGGGCSTFEENGATAGAERGGRAARLV